MYESFGQYAFFKLKFKFQKCIGLCKMFIGRESNIELIMQKQ